MNTFISYCQSYEVLKTLAPSVQKFYELPNPGLKDFQTFESACIDTLDGLKKSRPQEYTQHHQKILEQFDALFNDEKYRILMIRELKNYGSFYTDDTDKEILYVPDSISFINKQSQNAKPLMKLEITHEVQKKITSTKPADAIIIVSHFLRERIQIQINVAISEFEKTLPAFQEAINKDKPHSYAMATDGRKINVPTVYDIDYSAYQVGRFTTRQEGFRVTYSNDTLGADFNKFKNRYAVLGNRLISDLEKFRVKGTITEEAHYYSISAIRAFLRIFDVIGTFLSTCKLEAGTYNKDKRGQYSLFKPPKAARETQVKSDLKQTIERAVSTLLEQLDKIETGISPKKASP